MRRSYADSEMVKRTAAWLGLELTTADVAFFARALRPLADALDALEEMAPRTEAVRERVPAIDRADPYNCWRYRGVVGALKPGSASGMLVGVKDNIAVGGMPMTNGSRLLEGTVPLQDAMVVSRLLEGGATVVGKTNCEPFGSSGGSHLNDYGIVRNPCAPEHTSGGSSSGSAAAVAAGECDWALATDQGGSTRVPAAWCGVVGMKPTWGLVPYTGSISVEPMLDHIGLITSTVAGNEDMLRVVAETNSHAAASRGSTVPPRALGALRIGLLEEGFGLSNSDPAVDAAVREMAEKLRGAGHIVSNLSVPEHRASRIIYAGIVCPGSALQFLFGGNPSLNPGVLHENGQRQAGAVTGRDGAHLPDTVRSLLLIGGASLLHDRGVSYARAQIMTASLRATYDRALQEVDILLMPTVPFCAPRIPSRDSTREERLDRAVDMFTNTSAFNATGHPAMSVPCAQIGALPVGAMLVARHFNEDMIYAAGKAIEDLR